MVCSLCIYMHTFRFFRYLINNLLFLERSRSVGSAISICVKLRKCHDVFYIKEKEEGKRIKAVTLEKQMTDMSEVVICQIDQWGVRHFRTTDLVVSIVWQVRSRGCGSKGKGCGNWLISNFQIWSRLKTYVLVLMSWPTDYFLAVGHSPFFQLYTKDLEEISLCHWHCKLILTTYASC